MSVPFALSSAVAYGFGDFAGGLAARRSPVLRVTAVAQIAGLVALLPAAFLVPGHISAAALGLGAIVGAGLPLVAGVLGGERPGVVGWLALGVAIIAIALASAGSRGDTAAGAGLVYGLGAGVGFGLFFVALDLTPDGSGLWPLVAGRVVSVTLLALALLV